MCHTCTHVNIWELIIYRMEGLKCFSLLLYDSFLYSSKWLPPLSLLDLGQLPTLLLLFFHQPPLPLMPVPLQTVWCIYLCLFSVSLHLCWGSLVCLPLPPLLCSLLLSLSLPHATDCLSFKSLAGHQISAFHGTNDKSTGGGSFHLQTMICKGTLDEM